MYFIITVVLVIWIATLQSRVSRLEESNRQSAASTSQTVVPPVPVPTAPVAMVSPSPDPVLSSPTPPPAPSHDGDRFLAWLKEDFMVKVGAFLMILAVVFFLSYAFASGWIGPAGQVTIGLLLGAATMIIGVWRLPTFPSQGGIFTVLGATICLLSLMAAQSLYDLFTPLTALALAFLTVVFVAATSVVYSRKWLAFSGLVLAITAPYLLDLGSADVYLLMVYQLIVVSGTLWVVYYRGWSLLTLTAFLGTVLVTIGYLDSSLWSDVVLLFTYLFTAIFFVVNILGLIANESDENRPYHLTIAGLTGLNLILWVMAAVPSEWQSLTLVAWMLVFSLGSFIVYKALGTAVPFTIYGATSIGLLLIATWLEFGESPALLAFIFTLEVATLVVLALRLETAGALARRLALLFVLPVIMAMASAFSYEWRSGVPVDHLIVVMTLIGVLAGLSSLFRLRSDADRETSTSLAIVAGIFAAILLWQLLHAGSVPGSSAYGVATAITLIVYTLIGLGFTVVGKRRADSTLSAVGFSLLGFVVGRVLLIDLATMETGTRIITLFAIGGLLLSSAFLRRRATVLPTHRTPDNSDSV
jgi:uncharacterized membrane protein